MHLLEYIFKCNDDLFNLGQKCILVLFELHWHCNMSCKTCYFTLPPHIFVFSKLVITLKLVISHHL